MLTPSQLVWTQAGSPPSTRGIPAGSEGRCAICGAAFPHMVTFDSALPRASFTGQDQILIPDSPVVCLACCWVMEGRPPNTLRMWSIAYHAGQAGVRTEGAPDLGPDVTVVNKADPGPILRLLTDPPAGRWCCALADSGKLHVLPYAKVNQGAGRWMVRWDRENVWGTATALRTAVSHVAALLAAGFSKADIETREPSPVRVARCGIDIWRTHTCALGMGRAGQMERLSLFLLRKEMADGWI